MERSFYEVIIYKFVDLLLSSFLFKIFCQVFILPMAVHFVLYIEAIFKSCLGSKVYSTIANLFTVLSGGIFERI